MANIAWGDFCFARERFGNPNLESGFGVVFSFSNAIISVSHIYKLLKNYWLSALFSVFKNKKLQGKLIYFGLLWYGATFPLETQHNGALLCWVSKRKTNFACRICRPLFLMFPHLFQSLFMFVIWRLPYASLQTWNCQTYFGVFVSFLFFVDSFYLLF